jgi:hypothetical protein
MLDLKLAGLPAAEPAALPVVERLSSFSARTDACEAVTLAPSAISALEVVTAFP